MTPQLLRVRAVFDGEVGDRENELVSDVEGELMASFPDTHVEAEVVRLDDPLALRAAYLDLVAFQRYEIDESEPGAIDCDQQE